MGNDGSKIGETIKKLEVISRLHENNKHKCVQKVAKKIVLLISFAAWNLDINWPEKTVKCVYPITHDLKLFEVYFIHTNWKP